MCACIARSASSFYALLASLAPPGTPPTTVFHIKSTGWLFSLDPSKRKLWCHTNPFLYSSYHALIKVEFLARSSRFCPAKSMSRPLWVGHTLKIEMHMHAYPQPLGVASQWRSRYVFAPSSNPNLLRRGCMDMKYNLFNPFYIRANQYEPLFAKLSNFWRQDIFWRL
ncbi:hypothetical protein DFH06DRAFT_1378780 [Mycena polygramma]|nr:hypothetical protein DFH06DRAFT_1378780 [Mycena polygramma]